VSQAAAADSIQRPETPLRTLAFITGCGRSGTTVLGRLIERHPEVRYLNDRFDLWIRPFPFADIWGRRIDSARAGGRVALAGEDVPAHGEARTLFSALLNHERGDRPVLVEKLAINNFRLGFLRALRPDARIINIVRHGVEVAHSIEQRANAGRWYGQNERKWTLLAEHAWANGYGPLLSLCRTAYHRGLLEWRMSVEAAERHFREHPDAPALHLRYESLVADPVAAARTAQEFLGLAPGEAVERFAREEIRRQTPDASQREVPQGTEEIAGGTLRRLGYEF
jgi:hypothetical protein